MGSQLGCSFRDQESAAMGSCPGDRLQREEKIEGAEWGGSEKPAAGARVAEKAGPTRPAVRPASAPREGPLRPAAGPRYACASRPRPHAAPSG